MAQILPTIKLIRVNSSWDAPNVFSGTAWTQVTNVEGVKPQDWPVKNAELVKRGATGQIYGRVGEGYGDSVNVTVRTFHVAVLALETPRGVGSSKTGSNLSRGTVCSQ